MYPAVSFFDTWQWAGFRGSPVHGVSAVWLGKKMEALRAPPPTKSNTRFPWASLRPVPPSRTSKMQAVDSHHISFYFPVWPVQKNRSWRTVRYCKLNEVPTNCSCCSRCHFLPEQISIASGKWYAAIALADVSIPYPISRAHQKQLARTLIICCPIGQYVGLLFQRHTDRNW